MFWLALAELSGQVIGLDIIVPVDMPTHIKQNWVLRECTFYSMNKNFPYGCCELANVRACWPQSQGPTKSNTIPESFGIAPLKPRKEWPPSHPTRPFAKRWYVPFDEVGQKRTSSLKNFIYVALADMIEYAI